MRIKLSDKYQNEREEICNKNANSVFQVYIATVTGN